MIGEKIIVRADFYPDGSIIPLGITCNGDSMYIDKITRIDKNIMNNKTMYFCVSGCNEFILVYKNGLWFKQ